MLLNAKEARKLTVEGSKYNMGAIEKIIKDAASRGSLNVHIDMTSSKMAQNDKSIISQLKAAGYTVVREASCDQRDDTCWDYLTVSWK